MLPDPFGSDADYDSYYGRDWSLDQSRDDWCDEHQQRQTTCGKCHTAGALNEDGELVRKELTGSQMVAAVTAALAKVTARIK